MSKVETFLDKHAQWLSGESTDADIAVDSQCTLVRNLADFPFPSKCTDDEKKAVEERFVAALDSLNLLTTGTYYSLRELDPRERRFLVERRLITETLLESEGARGVFVAEDQSLSVSVNDENHITITGLVSGLQPQEVWSRVNLIDDTLGTGLDYAFDDRLGFLTTALSDLGPGLRCRVDVHLPAVNMAQEVFESHPDATIGDAGIVALVREKRHDIDPIFSADDEMGDLYAIVSTTALGRAEEEMLFSIRHLAGEVINQEREARARLQADAHIQLEDRVSRALGVARRSRILAFSEALSVLSSLRLGVSCQSLDRFSIQQLNEVLMAAQDAHIEMKCGHECDELTLSTERADLFRARFS